MPGDPSKLKMVKDLGSPGIALCLTRVPDCDRFYFGSSDFQVREIDMAADKPKPTTFAGPGHDSYVTGIALAGNRLISGGYDGRLIWWDRKTHKPIRKVDAHKLWIRRVVAGTDGKRIASVADDMLCRIWDAETGHKIRELAGHKLLTPHNYPSMLYAVAFSPDGKHLATGDRVGHVAVWETATGKKLKTLETPTMYTWDPKRRRHSIGGIRSLCFSPDGKRLAVGGMGQVGNIDHLQGEARTEVFNWKSGKRLLEIKDNKRKGLVEQIAFHHSGKWLLTAGGDHKGFLCFYDATSGKPIHQQAAKDHVHGVAFNEDHTRLYAAHHSRLTMWTL
ncbi:MAG: WD40 repeat domain-containing protein [Planctomycetaceae bacterium]